MPAERPGFSISEAIETGLQLHRAGRLPDAELIYNEILRRDAENPDALHLLGVIAYQAGRYDKAVLSIAKAIIHRPSEPDFHSNLGLALHRLKRHQEALSSYEKALALSPAHAGALNNRGSTLQELGRHEEALASYDLALAVRADYPEALSNRSDVLQKLGRYEEAVVGYDKALAINPRLAESLSNRGLALHKLGRNEEALRSCEEALKLKPDHVDAWANRGLALQSLKRAGEALACYDRASNLRPEDAEVQFGRGNLLYELRRYNEAIISYDRAIAIKPDYFEAFGNRGNALQALRHFDSALASYARAQEISPDYVLAHWNEALCRLLVGDYERGWEKYEWRWKRESIAASKPATLQAPWRSGDDIAGKTIFLQAEQGMGDTIQFARYAQAVARRGAKVILGVHAPLKPLFSTLVGASGILGQGEPLPAADLHCSLLSMPLAFGTRVDSVPAPIPYLSVAESAASEWRRKLASRGGRLIGLSWRGNPDYKGDVERSLPLSELRELLAVAGVQFVSLQKELSEGERALTGSLPNFVHPGGNFAATAELVAALDLVISVDTVWAHWAGAIGKPVCVLLPYAPHWCWLLDRDDSPWYPTARLFRQTEPGVWGEAVARVVRHVSQLPP